PPGAFYKVFTSWRLPFVRVPVGLNRVEGVLHMGPIPMNINQTQIYRDEHLSLDFDRQFVSLDSQRLTLTRKEYELLALLIQHAGEIIPRDALLMRVWGYGSEIRTRTLDVHVRRLRKKLGGYADQYIETIFGIGYRFQPYKAPRFFTDTLARPAIALRA